MATIFRGPTYAQQQQKPKQPGVLWNAPNLLITTLALASAVPFQTADVFVTPQHPSHQLSANADTSKGTPKTLIADAAKPFFVAPHFAPHHAGKNLWLNPDTSRGVPKTLTTDAARAFFVAPHFAPQHPRQRGQLNFDASEGTAKVLYVDAVAPALSPAHLQVDRLRPVADTSQSAPPFLLASQAPFLNTPQPQIGNPRIGSETSQSAPKVLFADSVAAFFNPPQIQVDRLRPVTDSSQSSALSLLTAAFVQPPFANPPHLAPVRVFWQPADMSVGIDEAPALQSPFANPPSIAAASPHRRGMQGSETSQSTPKPLYVDAVTPTFNPPSVLLDRLRLVADTSNDTPATLLLPVVSQAPFVNAPSPAAATPHRRGLSTPDTSQGTSQTLLGTQPAPFVNPPALAAATPHRRGFSTLDTSKGSYALDDSAVATAQLEFLPAPHLPRIGSETSQGSPQTLVPIGQVAAPFSNPPGFAVTRPWILADTSRGMVPPAPAPLLNTLARTTFVNQQKTQGNLGSETSRGTTPPVAVVAAPFVTPLWPAPDTRRPVVWDATQDLPNTLLTLAAPFSNPPGLAAPTPHRRGLSTVDTSQGTPKSLYADAVAPAFNPAPLLVDRLRPVADTSQGVPQGLLPVQAPLVNPPSLGVERPRGVVDTGRGSSPDALLAPFANPVAATVERARFIGDDWKQAALLTLLGVPAPFANLPASGLDRPRPLSETSAGTPKALYGDGSAAFANPPTLQVDRLRPVSDTSAAWPKVLYGDSVAPFVNAPSSQIDRPRAVADTAQDTAQDTPLALLPTPFVNAPQSAAATPHRRGLLPSDTSQESPLALLVGAPVVNPPGIAISVPRIVSETSQSTQKTLFGDAVAAFFNPPSLQLDRIRPVSDTSQSSPRSALAIVLTPTVNPPTLLVPRFFWQPADASLALPKALYSDAVSPFFNPPSHSVALPRLSSETSSGFQLDLFPAPPFANAPTLPVDVRRSVADTSQDSPPALLFVQAPFSNAPTLLVERPRAVGDTSSETFPALFVLLPPAPVFNAPQFQVAPVRVFSETSQSSSPALLSVSGVPFAQRDWTVAAEYRRRYVAKWDQPQFTPDAYPPPVPTPVLQPDSGGIWKQRTALRRYVAEQQALEQAKRDQELAKQALAALKIEKAAAADRAEAQRLVRETATAHRLQLKAALAAKAKLDAAMLAESAPKVAVAQPKPAAKVAAKVETAPAAAALPAAPAVTVEDLAAAHERLRADLDRANRKVAALMALLLKG